MLAHALNRISEGNRRSRDFTLESLRGVAAGGRRLLPRLPDVCQPARLDGGRPRADRDGGHARALAEPRDGERRSSTSSAKSCSLAATRRAGRQRGGRRAARRLRAGRHRRLHGAPGLLDAAPAVHRRRSRRRASRTPPSTATTRSSRSTRSAATRRASAARSPSSTRRTARARRGWPLEMTATATHDTKLGEDVRARISVLSRDSGRVAQARSRAGPRINTGHRDSVRGEPGTGPQRRVPLLPDPRRRLAGRRAPARRSAARRPRSRVHDQGDQGSQGPHQLGQRQRGLRPGDRRVRRADF